MRSRGVVGQVNCSRWEGEGVQRRGCGERPSGCVCKAKRPTVGAHLRTISPWRVALHTHTHTFPILQSTDEGWQLWLELLNSEMLHHDNRAVCAKQNVKNYRYNSKGLLDYSSFCQLFRSTLFIKPYFACFIPLTTNSIYKYKSCLHHCWPFPKYLDWLSILCAAMWC